MSKFQKHFKAICFYFKSEGYSMSELYLLEIIDYIVEFTTCFGEKTILFDKTPAPRSDCKDSKNGDITDAD